MQRRIDVSQKGFCYAPSVRPPLLKYEVLKAKLGQKLWVHLGKTLRNSDLRKAGNRASAKRRKKTATIYVQGVPRSPGLNLYREQFCNPPQNEPRTRCKYISFCITYLFCLLKDRLQYSSRHLVAGASAHHHAHTEGKGSC